MKSGDFTMDIASVCRDFQEAVVQMRRDLHRIPEYGDDLPKTRAYVCAKLDEFGIAYCLNEEGSGIVADIKGCGEGRTIAIRGDMDALHITEQTGLPFASESCGLMHACGHDAHTAILLAAGKVFKDNRDAFKGTVRLLFQPGEETGSGAKLMIRQGALENVDACICLHVGSLPGESYPTGAVSVIPGPVTCAKSKFTLTVRGMAAHVSSPHTGIDPILIAARILTGYEEIFARELPAGTPLTLAFGSIQSGVDHNTIPDTVVIKGDFRTQDRENVSNFVAQRMRQIATHICAAYRAECALEIIDGSSPVVNDEAFCRQAWEALEPIFGSENIQRKAPRPLLGSDDFANYASRVPSIYFRLRTSNPRKNIVSAPHKNKFDLDEDVLWKGVAAYVAICMKYLKEN